MDDADVVRIKRYPNRRFYDRSRGEYVTLADIEQAVRNGKTVEITDSKTNEDLTRVVLSQLLIERHPQKLALFPLGLLHAMLRADDAVTGFWQNWFHAMQSASEGLPGMAAPTMPFPFPSPMNWMSGWKSPGFGAASKPAESNEEPAAPEPDVEPPSNEPESLLDKIAALESRIRQLENKPERGEH